MLAPLANRLGLFRLKWEMEDLAFRCSQPEVYRSLARQLESKRIEREELRRRRRPGTGGDAEGARHPRHA